MISKLNKDGNGRLSFREFLLVYHKARTGDLDTGSGLGQLTTLTKVDVDIVGLNGVKELFEAKIHELSKGSKFGSIIREEQKEHKRMEKEKVIQRHQFLERLRIFQ